MTVQVGHLGGEYERWLQRPCAGQPRFFSSSLVENVTKTPWCGGLAYYFPVPRGSLSSCSHTTLRQRRWVVPLVWVPVVCALLLQVWRTTQRPFAQDCATVSAGLVAWQVRPGLSTSVMLGRVNVIDFISGGGVRHTPLHLPC